MIERLKQIVQFRGDRLFNGAVNIGWFNSDKEKAKLASQSFVFHGPKYHAVKQEDVDVQHGHKLVDTASFTRAVLRRCYGEETQPFTLAIAGYGTGKSHLGLTLANLIHNPQNDTAQHILSAIDIADTDIGNEARIILKESNQPCLVVALNGMQGFDLSAELASQIASILKEDGHDLKPLEDLRPRFSQAATLIKMSNSVLINELLEDAGKDSIDILLEKLEQQDERTYKLVHDFFASRGMPIRVLSGESIKDLARVSWLRCAKTSKPLETNGVRGV